MKREELEGLAVAYALLIMREWDVREMNQKILAEHGANALVRVKKRAWQHVRANAPTSGHVAKGEGSGRRQDAHGQEDSEPKAPGSS